MRYLLILLLPALAYCGTYLTPSSALQSGFSVKHECKDGVQIVVFTKGGLVFEQPYCHDRSTWDGDCKHAPIKCYTKDNK